MWGGLRTQRQQLGQLGGVDPGGAAAWTKQPPHKARPRSLVGEDALEKVAINAPDMIIADTKLPGMDGFQFATRVKEDPRTAAIPFLFLSSHNDIEHKVKGLELGVDDYLTKPIYIKEILTRVRILMDKRDKETLERRDRSGFTGVLGEMGVVDLIQTVELVRRATS